METKEPQRFADTPSHGLSGADIRELARALSADAPTISEPISGDEGHTSRSSPALVVIGALATLSGALIAGFGARTIGIGLAAVGLIALAAGIALRARHRVQGPNVEEIAAAVRAHEAASRRQHALDRLRDAGLPSDPLALGSIADEVDALASAERRHREWSLEVEELRQDVARRESTFRQVLAAHSQSSAEDVVERYAEYERECSERAASALMAAGREDLEARIAQRRDAEELTRQAGAEREAAKELLVASAAECGIEALDSQQIVSGLEAWLTDRRQSMAEHEAELKLWAELEAVLRGSDLESLEAELHEIESQLSTEDRSVEDRPEVVTRDIEREAARLRVDVEALRRDAAQATGRARERANQIPSVADAEEEVASAEAELERVRRLQRLLATSTDFLSRAEEKAHRNVAPKLKKHLEKWLPAITDGRHSEVAVDVDKLVIRVREDGALRPATSLSHGTAEQIYLLLRIALVEHLVGSNGPCPLLFDDVTVQSDAPRTVKIMEMLLTMSQDTQIIVFSQEEEVRRWAEATLHPPSNLLLDLTG